MQIFTLIVFLAVMLTDWLVKTLALPPILRFLPDALSCVVIVYVLFGGVRDRFRLVAPKYWIVFGAMIVVIICGIVNNQSGVGPLLSGARFYLRPVPMFFLPAVMYLNDQDLKRQLKWLLALGLFQVPVAVYQQYVIQSEGRFTGDDVRGTLMDSGILTLFLICTVLILTGMFLRKRIRPLTYWVLFFFLLIPTTINETKVTVIYLPLGLLATLLFGAERGKRLKYFMMACGALVIAGLLFIPIYNFTQRYNPYKNEKDITTFFTSEKALSRYLSSDVGGVGTKKDVRRGDAIVVPFEFLAKDPVRLAFGLGMGAVSPSTLGQNFEGQYYLLFQKFSIISFTFFLLEFGVFGVLLIGVLLWMMFRDTLAVARQDPSFVGVFAVGWTGVVMIFSLDVIYINFHQFPSVTYLYWYFAGLVGAHCVALAKDRVRGRPLSAATRAGSLSAS